MAGEPVLDIEGLVYVVDWENDSATTAPVTLDGLVADAVSPDMLEDEPQAVDLLLKFRQRLLSSVEHVNTALTTFRRPEATEALPLPPIT
jgi:hypothetical protein